MLSFHHGVHLGPCLNNITKLNLVWTGDDYRRNSDLFSCGSLMEACPNLYSFSVRFDWPCLKFMESRRPKSEWRINKCLKVVELTGYRGGEMQYEFYRCLLSSAPSLDKVLFDLSLICRDNWKHTIYWDLKRITNKLSHSAELVIR